MWNYIKSRQEFKNNLRSLHNKIRQKYYSTMKFQFRIYNLEVVDCSSCFNTIFPDPETREILLQIILKVCESDVIAAIGSFNFRLDTIEFQSPSVADTDDEDWKKNNSKYDLHSDENAKKNKIAGLIVEKEEYARNRIANLKYFRSNKTKKAYYIKPGLDGIRKGIGYIRQLYNNQKADLPEYLKNMKLQHFTFSAGVIWEMNVSFRQERETGNYDFIDYERDNIEGSSDESGFGFSFGNFGGDEDIYRSEYYLDHLNNITKVLDEVAPGKYMAGPDEMKDLLEYELLKKEGRKLVVGDEENYKEKFDQYLIDTSVRDYEEDYEEILRKEYFSLKEKADRGEKLTYTEQQDLEYNRKLVKAIDKKRGKFKLS